MIPEQSAGENGAFEAVRPASPKDSDRPHRGFTVRLEVVLQLLGQPSLDPFGRIQPGDERQLVGGQRGAKSL